MRARRLNYYEGSATHDNNTEIKHIMSRINEHVFKLYYNMHSSQILYMYNYRHPTTDKFKYTVHKYRYNIKYRIKYKSTTKRRNTK